MLDLRADEVGETHTWALAEAKICVNSELFKLMQPPTFRKQIGQVTWKSCGGQKQAEQA